jgi:hypothetical protein
MTQELPMVGSINPTSCLPGVIDISMSFLNVKSIFFLFFSVVKRSTTQQNLQIIPKANGP